VTWELLIKKYGIQKLEPVTVKKPPKYRPYVCKVVGTVDGFSVTRAFKTRRAVSNACILDLQ
jgi:hypothetical protein